ncbi:histidine phosphatase family protein [Paracoccus tibetensis]|uniref:Probable phosphoglycerate mutase n=1 Tax=Paracoccus tibetensis TaxID=336292 RepID=A0A1G5K6X4_9RHOB|nr:histidine phosphatase family protein [Paracoccus tibetensis]SCY95981.1 probable phosphoglycerate mutase [Paracoccus tibetensis]
MSLFLHPVFFLLRHGRTAHNAADLIAGATDAPLDDEGRRQAEAAACHWQALPLGRLQVSPMLRACQTAEPLLKRRPDLRAELAPLLAERNWGIWEGQPRAILNRNAGPEGGEGPETFRARVTAACAAIPGPAAGEAPPLLIGHSGTAREITALLDVPFIRPPNCALIRYHRGQDGAWRADPPELPAALSVEP